MKKESEYTLLKKAVGKGNQLAAKVLGISPEQLKRMTVLEKVQMVSDAIPLMTSEQKRVFRESQESPRNFWPSGSSEGVSFSA